ncbi:hypothetical protein L596_023181 [Steinernema carpocapsae]|uniref:Uncharacterized protein n=1 Tax=Steinernema carpocapsae TaxID=34508 RepID=A0A4U5MCX4_STECR|nr:hypothetical protein L596_023181 [Steinernema carpocapsae]
MAGPHGVFFRKLHHDVIVPLKERYEAWESQNGVEVIFAYQTIFAKTKLSNTGSSKVCWLLVVLNAPWTFLKGQRSSGLRRPRRTSSLSLGYLSSLTFLVRTKLTLVSPKILSGIFKKDENGSLVQESP